MHMHMHGMHAALSKLQLSRGLNAAGTASTVAFVMSALLAMSLTRASCCAARWRQRS
jgi:hypothetical protein